jgi:hypothetical protein
LLRGLRAGWALGRSGRGGEWPQAISILGWADTAPSRLANLNLFNYSKNFPITKLIQTWKLWKGQSLGSKYFQTFQGEILLQKEQLLFWEEVQNPNTIWIKKSEKKTILYSVWILMGFKHFGKYSINSPKLSLRMIFNTANWDWLTCIHKLEVTLQVANSLKKNIQKAFKFAFETPLN